MASMTNHEKALKMLELANEMVGFLKEAIATMEAEKAEPVEVKKETSIEDEKTSIPAEPESPASDQQAEETAEVFDPRDYRHAAFTEDRTLCGFKSNDLEVTTGDRVNCPKCLEAINAKGSETS